MAKPMEARNFEEVTVSNFRHQDGKARYAALGQEEEGPARPTMLTWRGNLAALSQKFNLYFFATSDKVHIIIPRDLRQSLPGITDLIVVPPITPQASAAAASTFMDHHAINHIKVGNFGHLEILLIARDDGDVIGYYTHLLKNETLKTDNRWTKAPVCETKPFFHENVAQSVWGLAIHEQSRLIAVSSNAREITLFSFGFIRDTFTPYEGDGEMLDQLAKGKLTKFPEFCAKDRLGDVLLTRAFDCKFVFNLGPVGDNIPSIDFTSKSNGSVQSIIATSIHGSLWAIDVAAGAPIHCEPDFHPPDEDAPHNISGWGVLSLPSHWFKLVPSPQKAFGLLDLEKVLVFDEKDTCGDLNITSSLKDIRQSSALHPLYARRLVRNKHAQEESLPQLTLDEQPEKLDRLHREPKDWGNFRLKKPEDTDRVLLQSACKSVLQILKQQLEAGTPYNHDYFFQTARLSFLNKNNWKEQLVTILETQNDPLDNPLIAAWIADAEKLRWHYQQSSCISSEKTAQLLYFLTLPLDSRLQIKDWASIETNFTNIVRGTPASERMISTRKERLLGAKTTREPNKPTLRERARKAVDNVSTEGQHLNAQEDAFLRPSDYHKFKPAILRTFVNDIQLLPPTYKLRQKPIQDALTPSPSCPVNRLIPTLCSNLTKQDLGPFHNQITHWSRLNFLASIPELSLVLVGSQIGRVALVGLTKFKNWVQSHPEPNPVADHDHVDISESLSQSIELPTYVEYDENEYKSEHLRNPRLSPQSQNLRNLRDRLNQRQAQSRKPSSLKENISQYQSQSQDIDDNRKLLEIGDDEGEIFTMRVEVILPLRKHDDKRSVSPLVGLSVSPVWSGEQNVKGRNEKGNTKLQGRMPWRVILHYWDHTIISYELSRDEEREELLIF